MFGPKQLLERALPAVAPGHSYEVINAAGFGLASFRELEVVAEGLDYNLDAVIVLTGNNEFLRRSLPVEGEGGGAKVLAALSRARLYRVWRGAVAALRRGRANPFDWEPHLVGAREREQVREDYARNLDEDRAALPEAGRQADPGHLAGQPPRLPALRPLPRPGGGHGKD